MLYRSESLFARPCCTKYCICWTHGGACSAETETDHLHKVDCRHALALAVAVCSAAEHRMKVSSDSSFKIAAAGRMLHAAAAHKATLHLQPAVPCSRQQPLIKTFGSYPIKFPSSLRVEKVLNDDNFGPQLPLAVQFILR